VIVGGDMNTQPGDPPFEALLAAGFADAFAAGRPLLTSPADNPRSQIDHVFVAGATASDVRAPRSTASDHLPVAVTLTLARCQRDGQTARASVTRNRPYLSVHRRTAANPAAASSSRTPSGWNLAEISVRSSSPSSNSTVRSMGGNRHPLRGGGPQPHLDPAPVGVPERHVLERRRVEVGTQFAVDDVQHVAVELGGDAGRVVVGGNQHVRRLHQVGAEEQPLARIQFGAQVVQELGAFGGHQVADGSAEERHQPGAAGRQRGEVPGEVADDAAGRCSPG
jgi:hypothetical protein